MATDISRPSSLSLVRDITYISENLGSLSGSNHRRGGEWPTWTSEQRMSSQGCSLCHETRFVVRWLACDYGGWGHDPV